MSKDMSILKWFKYFVIGKQWNVYNVWTLIPYPIGSNNAKIALSAMLAMGED